jgi:hypothetical protein
VKLSAPLLTVLSRCERRFQIEREYRVLRRRPREVFNELLQAALVQMANGLLPRPAAEEMSARLIEFATRPGFDTHQDPYTLTQDLCAAAHNILERISREPELKRLAVPPPSPAPGTSSRRGTYSHGTFGRRLRIIK